MGWVPRRFLVGARAPARFPESEAAAALFPGVDRRARPASSRHGGRRRGGGRDRRRHRLRRPPAADPPCRLPDQVALRARPRPNSSPSTCWPFAARILRTRPFAERRDAAGRARCRPWRLVESHSVDHRPSHRASVVRRVRVGRLRRDRCQATRPAVRPRQAGDDQDSSIAGPPIVSWGAIESTRTAARSDRCSWASTTTRASFISLATARGFPTPIVGRSSVAFRNCEPTASFGEEARAPGAISRWTGDKDLSWTPIDPGVVVEISYDQLEEGRFRHATRFHRWRPGQGPRLVAPGINSSARRASASPRSSS